MGFPDWTLLGMGLSLLGVLVALMLALLGQSPGFLKRTGLSGARLDQNVRAFTAYAFALLLLAIGFFIAGVPLGSPSDGTAAAVNIDAANQLPETGPTTQTISAELGLGSTPAVTATAATPVTGAFGGPPSDGLVGTPIETDQSETAISAITETATSATTISTPSPTSAQSPSSTPLIEIPTTTPTATPNPTRTPSPTISPTPILSPTALIDTAGSTIWLLRSPGGRNLVTVTDGEVVILLPRHANQGGLLWREVSTGFGITGWIQEEFLSYSE